MNTYMKPIILAFFLCLLGQSFVFSQKYGNEWINYKQSYYSFKIVKDGLYKLDYTTLRNSGIDVKQFSSQNIQLIAREREVPLYFFDGGDNKLDSGDYFIFYAKKNDGWLDSILYSNPVDIGNPSYSLINDTINYFFTWNTKTTNLRFKLENSTDYNSYTPANYWISKSLMGNASYYVESLGNSEESSTFYKAGEGWSFSVDGVKSNQSFDIPLLNINSLYTGNGAPDAYLECKNTSHSNAGYSLKGNHHTRISLKPSNTILLDSIYSGYRMIYTQKSIPVTTLLSGNILNFSILNDQGALTDFQGLGSISFSYPMQTTLEGRNNGLYWLKNNKSGPKIRLDIQNTTLVKPLALAFGDTPRFLTVTSAGSGKWQVLVPNNLSSSEQEFIIQDATLLKQCPALIPVNNSSFFTDYSLISGEDALIMVYPELLKQSAAEYASYRSSLQGGGHNVIFAQVDELYLQFGGGIPKHFLGIRRFAKKIYDQSIHKPQALFLLGKGLSNTLIRTNTQNYTNCLIPTFGFPSSDIAYTAGFNGNFEPLIPTGRVTVTSNTELTNYLSKVKEYEAQQDQHSVYSTEKKDWQKQILHFAGGSTISQQSTFQKYLKQLEQIIVNKHFGANVNNVYKQTSDPINPIQLGKVTKRIQDGVSIMNFFGHSSSSTFDVGIDDPVNWNNKGKYPIVFGNGCNAGDVYSTNPTFSEQLVASANVGGVAFLSPASLGYDNYLFKYANQLYRQISVENYGATLGFQIKKVISSIYSSPSNTLDEVTCFNMCLNGDPMLRINYHNKPEIEILEENVTFSPSNLTLATDSIQLALVLKNLGKTIEDTFALEIKRKFPKFNTDSTYRYLIPGLNYVDTMFFKFPLQANIGTGANTFEINVDIPSFIEEQYDEISNNQLSKKFIINIDGILPVYPYEFAVVPNDSVVIKASTTNPFATLKRYRFELDTTDAFNSPFKKVKIVTGYGGVQEVYPGEWKDVQNINISPLVCEDSMVYYWRVAIDTAILDWRESSFQYVKNRRGWGQANFYQFKNNDYLKLSYVRNSREKIFDTIFKKLEVRVYDHPTSQYMYSNTDYRINNEMQDYAGCGVTPALHVVVIDPITLKPWRTHYGNQNTQNSFGNYNENGVCRKRTEGYFVFNQDDPANLASFQDMVENKIPKGHYIIIYSLRYADYNSWNNLSPTIYKTFKDLGSDSIKPGLNNQAFIFFCKKGDKSSVEEHIASFNGEYLYLKKDLVGFDKQGSEKTPFIGPSSNWKSIYWQQSPREVASKDTTVLTIEGYDYTFNLVKSIDTLMSLSDSIVQLNNLFDPTKITYLKLKADYKDNNVFTPANLKRWQVIYQPVPEAAINARDKVTWLPTSDTIPEGMKVKFAVDITNISEFPMDSLKVKYWITDANQGTHMIDYPRQDSLRINVTLRDTVEFITSGIPGLNTFNVEVNPYISEFVTDQPEQLHFNNIAQKNFFVESDKTNPILDVTFDGRHIMHGDLVSAKPEILISLKDENEFAIMNAVSDTSLFSVYIVSPDGKQSRIPFTNSKGNVVMQWVPANSQNKRFKILYPANFEKDGKYTLLVQGADRNGNLSGVLDYKITFEIVHESSISYLSNYPNPFSNSTRFVYTLTGSQVPDKMIIQIMTITGKVVREISEDELGPLQVGRNNITHFAWDGKDNFGDQLANGVYLYRVVSRIKGEEIKHRTSEVDNQFKNEFGKMYLMR